MAVKFQGGKAVPVNEFGVDEMDRAEFITDVREAVRLLKQADERLRRASKLAIGKPGIGGVMAGLGAKLREVIASAESAMR